MSRRTGTILALALVLSVALTAGCSKPATNNPQPPGDTVVSGAHRQWGSAWGDQTSVEMLDAQNGWVITRDAILRTTDGGARWVKVTPNIDAGSGGTDGGFGQACFPGPDTAFLARTEGANARAVTLYRTADGGTSWNKTSVTTSPVDVPTPRSIGFSDETHGWMLVNFGGVAMGSEMVGIYTTADGGASWQPAAITDPASQRPNSLPLGGIKSGVTFMNDKIGWVAGSWHGDGVWLYVTLDGGRTWQRGGLPVPKGYSTEGGAVRTLAPMFFGKDGLIPAVFSQSIIFFSTADGGVTWKATTPVPSGADSNNFAWTFIDAAHGWLSDTQRLYGTVDGGVTWKEIVADKRLSGLVQSGFRITQLEFVDASNGRALLLSGASDTGTRALLRTIDGGQTWSNCADPTSTGK